MFLQERSGTNVFNYILVNFSFSLLCANTILFFLNNIIECYYWSFSACTVAGSNVMKSIHGVGELMTQVVLRGGGLLPATPTHQPEGEVVKAQTEPEREDIMVMDTKLKVIEILQVRHQETGSSLTVFSFFLKFFLTL